MVLPDLMESEDNLNDYVRLRNIEGKVSIKKSRKNGDFEEDKGESVKDESMPVINIAEDERQELNNLDLTANSEQESTADNNNKCDKKTPESNKGTKKKKKGILKNQRTYSKKHVDFNMDLEFVPFDESKDYTVEIQIVEKMPVKIVSYAALFAQQKKEEEEKLLKEAEEKAKQNLKLNKKKMKNLKQDKQNDSPNGGIEQNNNLLKENKSGNHLDVDDTGDGKDDFSESSYNSDNDRADHFETNIDNENDGDMKEKDELSENSYSDIDRREHFDTSLNTENDSVMNEKDEFSENSNSEFDKGGHFDTSLKTESEGEINEKDEVSEISYSDIDKEHFDTTSSLNSESESEMNEKDDLSESSYHSDDDNGEHFDASLNVQSDGVDIDEFSENSYHSDIDKGEHFETSLNTQSEGVMNEKNESNENTYNSDIDKKEHFNSTLNTESKGIVNGKYEFDDNSYQSDIVEEHSDTSLNKENGGVFVKDNKTLGNQSEEEIKHAQPANDLTLYLNYIKNGREIFQGDHNEPTQNKYKNNLKTQEMNESYKNAMLLQNNVDNLQFFCVPAKKQRSNSLSDLDDARKRQHFVGLRLPREIEIILSRQLEKHYYE